MPHNQKHSFLACPGLSLSKAQNPEPVLSVVEISFGLWTLSRAKPRGTLTSQSLYNLKLLISAFYFYRTRISTIQKVLQSLIHVLITVLCINKIQFKSIFNAK